MYLISDEIIFGSVLVVLASNGHVLLQTVKFCTRHVTFCTIKSQLAQYSHGKHQTVTVGTRQCRFTPDSHVLHHTVSFCNRARA